MAANYHTGTNLAPDPGKLPTQGNCLCPGAPCADASKAASGVEAGRFPVVGAMLVFLGPVAVVLAVAWLLAGSGPGQAAAAAGLSVVILGLTSLFRKSRQGDLSQDQTADPRCFSGQSRGKDACGGGR